MKQILGNKKLENAFDELGIFSSEYSLKYRMKKSPHYCIWELTDNAYETLSDFPDDKWKDNWGWWRYADGSNMGEAKDCGMINGLNIKIWRDDYKRGELLQEWKLERSIEEKREYHNNFEEFYEVWCPNCWDTLLDYFSDEIGCSSETNICALATDLAKQNGMTMAELFRDLQEG